MRLKRLITVGALACGMSVIATATPAFAATTVIQGAGSTLVAPLMSYWGAGFQAATAAGTAYAIQYAAVGSGTGITDSESVTSPTFGASDFTIGQHGNSVSSWSKGVVQLPWALTSSDLVYNLPKSIGNGVQIDATVANDIFQGKIKTWNNKAILKIQTKAVAAKLKKIHTKITPVYREDSSGDSFVVEEYLGYSAPSGTWPYSVGVEEEGNPGVLAEVKAVKGGFGYVANPYVWGETTKGPVYVAAVQNKAKKYEFPNLPEIEEAAKSVTSPPAQGNTFAVNIVNPGKAYKTAYPISTYTYGLIPLGIWSSADAAGLNAFLTWVFSSSGGQAVGEDLGYVAPLPAAILNYDRSEIPAASALS